METVLIGDFVDVAVSEAIFACPFAAGPSIVTGLLSRLLCGGQVSK